MMKDDRFQQASRPGGRQPISGKRAADVRGLRGFLCEHRLFAPEVGARIGASCGRVRRAQLMRMHGLGADSGALKLSRSSNTTAKADNPKQEACF